MMGIFEFVRWATGALVTISAQIHSNSRKLDILLKSSNNVPTEQLKELAEESANLRAKTQALHAAIDKQKGQ